MAVSYFEDGCCETDSNAIAIAPYVFWGSCLLQTTVGIGGSLLVVFALFGDVLLPGREGGAENAGHPQGGSVLLLRGCVQHGLCCIKARKQN